MDKGNTSTDEKLQAWGPWIAPGVGAAASTPSPAASGPAEGRGSAEFLHEPGDSLEARG